MSYYFNKILEIDFDGAISQVKNQLKKEGFGVLTEIDVKKTMRLKLDKEFRKYTILGACNPPYAYEALLAEDKIGTMLPCNVIVQEISDTKVEVAVVDPISSMRAIQNPNLQAVASQIQAKLQRVVADL